MSASTPTSLLSAPQGLPNPRAKERILAAAYDLFSRHGIRAVGIDAIIEQSGVARMTLYRHFSCKEQLVLAFLEQRAQFWSSGWLQAEVMRRGATARDRLLAIFDVFAEWFRVEGFEGCTFINVMLETPNPDDRIRRASVEYLERIRQFIAQLAGEAGIHDRDGFARKWHILMKGAIVFRRRRRPRGRRPGARDRRARARRRAGARRSQSAVTAGKSPAPQGRS